jgi:glucose uptake protein GlcU
VKQFKQFLSIIPFFSYRRNEPYTNNRIVLPSLAGGLMYSAGSVFFFLSLQKLSLSIVGPIATMLPGCVGSAWSVYYFREIEVLTQKLSLFPCKWINNRRSV